MHPPTAVFWKLNSKPTKKEQSKKGSPLILLSPSLNNRFKRITLVHKEKLDRCTIDIALVFWNKNGKISFNNLIIFELKKGRNLNMSPFIGILRQLKIRQAGLSKYCTGRAMLDASLKQNAFKPKLRLLHKEFTHLNTEILL